MMQSLGGIPLVEFVYRRCATSKKADIVSVITSADNSDDELFDHCISRGLHVYRGSLNNVLERYVRAAASCGSKLICRVCGDSPFVDVELLDKMFDLIEKERLDYVAPDREYCMAGLDSEIVTYGALENSLSDSVSKDELEHVTLHIKNNAHSFKTRFIETDLMPDNANTASVTVDYPEDLILCNRILKTVGGGYSFRSRDILNALEKWGRGDA